MLLSSEAEGVRSLHANASKAHRDVSQAAQEADEAAELAKGSLYEYISSKVGVNNDPTFIKLRDAAMAAAFKQNQVKEDYVATQSSYLKKLETELKFLHIAIASIQAKLGIGNL